MGQISIEPDKALAQAKKLNELAQMCYAQEREARRIIEEISSVWIGESGDMMRVKYEEWAEEQKECGIELERISENIKNTVQSIVDEDEKMAGNSIPFSLWG